MANDFIRNAEGYYDPTAGTALEKVRREREIMDIKAYDIIKTTRSNGRDKRFFILAITGIVATGLELRDSYMPGAISVICGAQVYAHPEKVEYIFLNAASWSISERLRTARFQRSGRRLLMSLESRQNPRQRIRQRMKLPRKRSRSQRNRQRNLSGRTPVQRFTEACMNPYLRR